MKYVSTGGRSPAVDLETALFRSLAPDGGLYLPQALPRFPWPLPEPAAAADPLSATARQLAPALLPDLPREVVEAVVDDALDFPVPLVPVPPQAVHPGVWVLELFHGPTLAFKDVGARFMARLFARLRGHDSRPLTVLVATSGDTGSAVAQAFLGLEGTRVVILYPKGKVSPVQECQFTTLGDNVHALAVAGTFDDCQRLVKGAFADAELSAALRLTSANSINLGRLLPQSFYYFHAAAQLPAGAPPPVISVPSGNFGNLTAGLLAKRMGLPCSLFVAATNVNDVVPDYLESGRFRPRPSLSTISNAMDVGNPSNFARILALYDGNLEEIRQDVIGVRCTDEETAETIRRVYRETDYLLDPHTAVAWGGLNRSLTRDHMDLPSIVLATAHPAKFREAVEPAIGTSVALPERLAVCLDRPSRAQDLDPDAKELEAYLRSI